MINMAYGVAGNAGLELYIRNFAALQTDGNDPLTAENITTARAAADKWIDRKIAAVVPTASLPLAVHDMIDDISDKRTACLIKQAYTIGVSPNENNNNIWLCDLAEKELDELLENPQSLVDVTGAALAADQILSSTLDQDREFSNETRSQGEVTSDEYGDTMGDWDDAGTN